MGVALAALMFGHPLWTKLPDLKLATKHIPDEALGNCDHLLKDKVREYTDRKREAACSNIHPSGLVLMQQLKSNKFSTQFNPIPVVVTASSSTGTDTAPANPPILMTRVRMFMTCHIFIQASISILN
jgi:hypothetical protein